jgi:hypothetical protein
VVLKVLFAYDGIESGMQDAQKSSGHLKSLPMMLETEHYSSLEPFFLGVPSNTLQQDTSKDNILSGMDASIVC